MNDFRHRTRAGHNSGRHSKQVSQVTTGKRCFVDLGDGRSAWGRRWRDLCLSHANDLGGTEILTEVQVSIIKRVAALECEWRKSLPFSRGGDVLNGTLANWRTFC
jgi:hypothetical protein